MFDKLGIYQFLKDFGKAGQDGYGSVTVKVKFVTPFEQRDYSGGFPIRGKFRGLQGEIKHTGDGS